MCQIVIFPYFISVNMEFQVVLSTERNFETIFIVALQDVPSQLNTVSLTTSLYYVWMILVLIGTVNAEGITIALNLYSISKMISIVL